MEGGLDTTTRGRRDERVRTDAFAFRLIAAAIVVALSPLVDEVGGDERILFAWATALGWMPAAGVIEAFRRRRPGLAADLLNLGLDFGFLFFMLAVFDVVVVFLLAAQLLVVGYYTYLGGPSLGIGAAALALVSVVGAREVTEPRLEPVVVALYPIVVVGMVLLMRRLATHHIEAAADIARLHDKAAAIATGVAEAVVVTSPRGRIREWNAAAETSLRCPSDAAIGQGCAEVLGLRRELEELECSEGCALLRAQLAEGGFDGGIKVWREDGSRDQRQALLAHAAPLTDDDGRVVEVVHSFRDVSKLVEADEAKTVFLATATHELKTPLTVIMGFSELLSRRPDLPDGEREQALQSIQDRARQLSDIVDRVLLSSRIEAGRVDLDTGPIAVEELIEERARAILSVVGRSPDLRVATDLPLAIADEDALATVIDHLLDNAVKYSEPDTVVTVEAGADDRSVYVAVTDHGIGMAADEVARCTERFWQAESGDVRRFGGTGIGLYVVKSLVDAMRGDLEVASTPGVGTTFAVWLARADAQTSGSGEGVGDREPSIIREFMRQAGVSGGGQA